MMATGVGSFAPFGQVLDFMKSCVSDYSMNMGVNYELMNYSMANSLWPINPVTVLGSLQSMMMMETGCQMDTRNVGFGVCAAAAYNRCGANFVNPTNYTDQSYWTNEFQPMKQGIDCILDAVNNGTSGFGMGMESTCSTWIRQTPAYMCYSSIGMSMCTGSLTNQTDVSSIIDCLVQNVGMGMIAGDCKKALSNYPSNFLALNSTAQLQYQEAFYGLVANPKGDPFAVSTSAPTMSPSSGDTPMAQEYDAPKGDKTPLVVLVVVLLVAFSGVVGFVLYRSRRGQALCPCIKKSGHEFDEVPKEKAATTQMDDVQIR
jgi:hypothetical protein